jgi:hypothetical protein
MGRSEPAGQNVVPLSLPVLQEKAKGSIDPDGQYHPSGHNPEQLGAETMLSPSALPYVPPGQ